MDETSYIWMDGNIVPWKEAKVHILTHTLHYGLGVFEGIRFYETDKGPAIFQLDGHIKRMLNGAEIAFMKVPYTEEEIKLAILEIIRKNGIPAGYIRPIIYYGYGKMGLDPHGAPVNLAIAIWPWGLYLGEEAVRVKTSEFIRIHPKTTFTATKITGHYVNSIFASCEAKSQGYHEALLLDYKGNVAEGPGENLFIISEGILFTPKLGNILRGITRGCIIEIARDAGITVEETELVLEDVYGADEAFFTGTAAEVTAIASLDDKKIGNIIPGPVTSKLKSLFIDIIRGKNEKYKKWLTYVND